VKKMIQKYVDEYSRMRTGVKKVTVGGAAGAPLAVIITYFIEMLSGMTVPAEVSAAFGSLLTMLFGYVTPPSVREE